MRGIVLKLCFVGLDLTCVPSCGAKDVSIHRWHDNCGHDLECSYNNESVNFFCGRLDIFR